MATEKDLDVLLDPIVDLTSPLSSVDATSKDRAFVQEELEKRLKQRVGRQDLVQRNILPPLATPTAPKLFIHSQQLQRAQNADNLQKKLRNRPDRSDLQQLNILPDLHLNIDPALQAKQVQLMRSRKVDSLNEKLANRPGPIQLLKDRILEPGLAAVIEDVDLERELGANEQSQDIPSISLQRTASETRHKPLQQRHSIATSAPTFNQLGSGSVSPSKDLTSPLTLDAQRRKMSDSSLSPANSPADLYNDDSSSPPMASPRGFNSSYPPSSVMPPNPAFTPGILASGVGKAPSPSQTRKKAQKQQKYRKLRYHEYVPPTKNAPKGGKQTPKTPPASNSPYDMILRQQQLFLQLQVLHKQNTNGSIMHKLPDLINSLSKEQKSIALAAVQAGQIPVSTASGEMSISLPKQVSVTPQLPQIISVEMPNKQNTTSVRFDDLKVSDLKAACKEMGMIVSGKKAELVERLLEANKRVLPARALPDISAKDSRRQAFSVGATSSIDSQLSGPPTSSPSSAPNSPVFTYPSEHHNGVLQHSQTYSPGMKPHSNNHPHRVESMPSMIPEVFPASTLQHKFEEMIQQQKRTYISNKSGVGAKSLAPCPDLNELVAIKLPSYPCPAPPTYQQSVGQKNGKGGGALSQRSSEPKLQLHIGSGDRSSRSLPSSPVTQGEDMLTELMDDNNAINSSAMTTPSSLATTSNGIISSLSDTSYLAPSCSPLSLTTTAAHMENAMMGSNTVVSPGMVSSAMAHARHLQDELPLRPGRMSVPETMRVKVHPMNPPSYEASVHRSISLSGPPPQMGRAHNSASFNSDLSEVVGGDMNNHALHQDTMMMDMDMPMETGENQFSDFLDIFKAEGYSHSAQPQSLPALIPHHHTLNSHHQMNYTSPTKLAPRQESLQSDSVMLGAMTSQNPLNKSLTGSDLCLSVPGQDNSRNSIGSGSYNMGGNNVMLGNELSWLDLENAGNGSNLAFTPGFANIGSQSNPGSLPHDQFQMQFLDDNGGQLGSNFMRVSNPSLNGIGTVSNDVGTFLDSSLSHQSGLPDENTLLELGLSTS